MDIEASLQLLLILTWNRQSNVMYIHVVTHHTHVLHKNIKREHQYLCRIESRQSSIIWFGTSPFLLWTPHIRIYNKSHWNSPTYAFVYFSFIRILYQSFLIISFKFITTRDLHELLKLPSFSSNEKLISKRWLPKGQIRSQFKASRFFSRFIGNVMELHTNGRWDYDNFSHINASPHNLFNS